MQALTRRTPRGVWLGIIIGIIPLWLLRTSSFYQQSPEPGLWLFILMSATTCVSVLLMRWGAIYDQGSPKYERLVTASAVILLTEVFYLLLFILLRTTR